MFENMNKIITTWSEKKNQIVPGPSREVRRGPGTTPSLLSTSLELKIEVKQGFENSKKSIFYFHRVISQEGPYSLWEFFIPFSGTVE